MTDFHDSEYSLPELVIQGHTERSIANSCDQRIVALIDQWADREPRYESGVGAFKLDKSLTFEIDYNGQSSDHWPDAKANLVAESLIRDILYSDGICDVDKFEPTLFQVNFSVLAMVETEYLLVLPFPTEAGNIAGLAVVCVNHYMRKHD